jgi:ornithine lipid ester-linked acyl 2-hydroxylase
LNEYFYDGYNCSIGYTQFITMFVKEINLNINISSMIYFAILLSFVIIVCFLYRNNSRSIRHHPFYNVKYIYPELLIFNKYYRVIQNEVNQVLYQKWIDWPEKELYQNSVSWTIFPFYGFGVYDLENCQKMPVLAKLLSTIPNLKLATLSRTSPSTKLTPHRGWKSHSNHALRCHFGIYVPENKSSIHVKINDKEYKQYHKNNSWLVFDDSEIHWSENNSNQDRIILIVDIERPNHVPKGTSDVEDTKELTNLIQHFQNKNLSPTRRDRATQTEAPYTYS